MSKTVKKIASVVAPIAGNAILPGIGGVIGGAAGGALSGGGLRAALLGGLSGAATGYAPQIGGFANNALGLGLDPNGTAISALGGGIGGAGAGLLSGSGLKGALAGGLGGAASGYLGNGGLSEIGNTLGITGDGSLLGTTAGTPLSNGIGPTQGSGILGAATRDLSNVGAALGGGTGGGTSSYGGGNALASILGGISSTSANNDAEDSLLEAQRKALSRYQPYVDAKFNPGDLTQDPGYQFRLQQGQQALDRQQSAKGSLFSGSALKAAQDYGQGLADSTYNDAYNRWLQQNQQNIGVAGALGNLDLEGGNAQANAGIANSNVINRALSSVLGGYGAYSNTGNSLGGGQLVGYDSQGKPIYR